MHVKKTVPFNQSNLCLLNAFESVCRSRNGHCKIMQPINQRKNNW